MAQTWSGWQHEFLVAAQVLDTPGARQFLTDWSAHAETNCADNPIDLSAQVAGSKDCAALPAIIPKAQRYTTHGNAAHAFYVQTHRASSTALLAALKSGDPYTVSNTGVVAEELTAWGSATFAHWYFAQTAGARGGGGGAGGGKAARAHSGWNDLRRTVNHRLPKALRTSQHNTTAALRSLSRARKVRL